MKTPQPVTEAQPADAVGTATAFGTFGELLQGALPDGTDFLVTLPIARWSTAHFLFDPDAAAVHTRPADRSKSRQLAEMMLDRYRFRGGGVLRLYGELPVGKGLASSSADLVATARAVGRALGIHPQPAEIEDLLRLIEPTDGVMYPGVVVFHHREVRLRVRLGHLPPLTVVSIDEGGEVETTSFNRRPKNYSIRDKLTYERLLTELSAAIRRGDAATIGRVATQSVRMNQRLCPKRTLDQMVAVCEAVGGLGVVSAHSGTVLGLLLSNTVPDHEGQLEKARLACSQLADTVWVDRCLPTGTGTTDAGSAYCAGSAIARQEHRRLKECSPW
jgi:L-threonine kinase